MDTIVKNWIENSGCDNIKTCLFCQHVGAVACGAKPAAIINISADDFMRCRPIKTRVSVKVIARNGNMLKAFVYNRLELLKVLRDDKCKRTLSGLGYKDTADSEGLIRQMVDRIRNQTEFPHEIGIFLGYPLKDVCGYMGINELKLTKKLGWRMYGDTLESEEIYFKRKRVRQQIGRMLNESQYLTV